MTGSSTRAQDLTARAGSAQAASARSVVVVNGDPAVVDLLDEALDGGRYNMTFVDVKDGAYSSIRLLQPDLVILYARIQDIDAFRLLTMLKMDPITQLIPILTFTDDEDAPAIEPSDDDEFTSDLPAFPPPHASRMN